MGISWDAGAVALNVLFCKVRVLVVFEEEGALGYVCYVGLAIGRRLGSADR